MSYIRRNYPYFHGASKLVELERIVSPTTFERIGGVVTDPASFCPVARCVGTVIGTFKTSGGTAELKLVEDDLTGTPRDLSAALLLPDTSGTWQFFQFQTNVVPTAGPHVYRLEGRRVTAASFEVQYVSVSINEV